MSPRWKAIIAEAAKAHRVRFADVMGPSRVRAVAYARFEAMFRLREIGLSYPKIGSIFGCDHTSVLHGCNRWLELAEQCGRPVFSRPTVEREHLLQEVGRLQTVVEQHLARICEIDRLLSAEEAA